jgi:hypothetical protein
MAFGPTADLDNVSLVKTVSPAALSVTITRPSTNVKYVSLKANWSAAETGANTSATYVFPETTGKTTLLTSQRPFAVRYTASTYANGSGSSTVVNSAGNITVTMTGFTASAENYAQLLW